MADTALCALNNTNDRIHADETMQRPTTQSNTFSRIPSPILTTLLFVDLSVLMWIYPAISYDYQAVPQIQVKFNIGVGH